MVLQTAKITKDSLQYFDWLSNWLIDHRSDVIWPCKPSLIHSLYKILNFDHGNLLKKICNETTWRNESTIIATFLYYKNHSVIKYKLGLLCFICVTRLTGHVYTHQVQITPPPQHKINNKAKHKFFSKKVKKIRGRVGRGCRGRDSHKFDELTLTRCWFSIMAEVADPLHHIYLQMHIYCIRSV